MDQPTSNDRDFAAMYRIGYLLARHVQQRLTEAEANELAAWRAASTHNEKLFQEYTDPNNVEKYLNAYQSVDTEAYLRSTQELISRKKRLRKVKLGLAIAASLVVLFFAVWQFWSPGSFEPKEPITINEADPAQATATLTLANGEVMELGRNRADTVLDNVARIRDKVGELQYEPNAELQRWHTLTVPRGGFYQLQLPDGSRVWLNSESSLRFPTRFSDGERLVEMTGEIYVEVVPDKARPFRVKTGDLIVEALGTAFNINAYSDEPERVTTLVEGSIRLSAQNEELILFPDEAGRLNDKGLRKAKVDGSIATGWIHNEFVLDNTQMQEFARQLSRWYNTEIVCEKGLDLRLNGRFPRDLPLSRLKTLLEKTGEIRLEQSENRIIIKN